MLKLIFIIILFIIVLYCITNKVHFKFKTFLQRGYFIDYNPYGIYCYHNKQGSGKTQSAVAFLLENTNYPIYANLKSIKGIEYYYFSGWNQLLEIGTSKSNCIIFYDELFKGFYKGKKMSDKDKEILMDFMSQMRKRHIIFITTAQEWLEIPIEFRRYVRFDIECSLISIFGYPVLRKIFHNTELIKWDNLENEYVSPIIGTYIEHGRKKIVNSYDTFEQISSEEIPFFRVFNEFSTNILVNDKSLKYDRKNIELDNSNNNVVSSALNEQKNNIIDNSSFFSKNNLIKSNVSFFKSVKHIVSLCTTTIRKRCAMCQFTNIFTKNKNKYNNNVKSNFNNIDTDFWGNSNISNLEDNDN